MSFSDRPLSFAGSQESSFIVWLIVAPERWTWALLPVRRGIPRVHFVLPRLAPRVERVVHHHAVLQHLVVVGEVARETEGDRGEPGRLRREVQVRGIRSADDKGELTKRGIRQAVVLQKSVEAAVIALVRKVNIRDVIRRRVAFLCRGEHLFRRNVEELRPGVDETRDQPGAGDAVDLRAFARHPARVRSSGLRVERAARGLPTLFDPALQVLRGEGWKAAGGAL